MNDWAQIRYLSQSEKLSGREIAQRLRVSRHTVAKALASNMPPAYTPRPAVASAWSTVEASVRGLLSEYPDMPSTVLAQRIGWTGSQRWFRENVARIRSEYRRVDPSDRLVHLPGEEVQCDLMFPPADIPIGDGVANRFPLLVMVASFARFITATLVPSRSTGDLLDGMWRLLSTSIGAVPKRLLWDNEAGIGQRGRLAHGVQEWCGVLGTRITQAKPHDPETKGVVERANRFVETSFLPGRSFECVGDFTGQLSHWLTTHGNRRRVRTIGGRPCDMIDQDRAAMNALPPVPPPRERFRVRLGRDYYVRAASNDYSVDPSVIGRLVDVEIGWDQIRVTCAGRLVAEHPRWWGRSRTITDLAHVAIASRLRQDYQKPHLRAVVDMTRDLREYDQAFGVDLSCEADHDQFTSRQAA